MNEWVGVWAGLGDGCGLREGPEPRGLDQWEGMLSPQWAGLRVWGRGLARGRG